MTIIVKRQGSSITFKLDWAVLLLAMTLVAQMT